MNLTPAKRLALGFVYEATGGDPDVFVSLEQIGAIGRYRKFQRRVLDRLVGEGAIVRWCCYDAPPFANPRQWSWVEYRYSITEAGIAAVEGGASC